MSNDITLSKTIMFLRFPLIVAVVFIHTNLNDVNIGGNLLIQEGQFIFHNTLRHLITNEIARIAVPLFFFFSGFLFFFHTDFSLLTYKSKLKKRFYTLFIPYIFWNIVVLGLTFLAQALLSSMTSGVNILKTDNTFSNWFGVFWNYRDGFPICYQFWFIRDLIVVVVCSPIVYWFIRFFKMISIFLLGILFCFNIWIPIIGFSSDAFFFFSFGAWFAIHNRNFTIDFKFLRWPFTYLYLLFVVVDTILWYNHILEFLFIHKIGLIIGLITIIAWTAHGIQKGILKCNSILTSSSFFIYAYHAMPIAFLVKLWVKLIQPSTEVTMIVGYIFIPIIVVGLGIGIYILMLKIFPRFTAFITGGRNIS